MYGFFPSAAKTAVKAAEYGVCKPDFKRMIEG
jgi:hypothetical protein